jgi:hypothetical protein
VAVRLVQPADVAGELDGRHLQAEADAEERNLALPGVLHGGDLPLRPAHAEPARHQDGVGVLQQGIGAELLDLRRVDEVERDPTVVGDPAVDQRLVQRFVRLGEIDVLADHRDANLARRLLDRLDDALPLVEPRCAAPDVEQLRHPIVETFLVQRERQLVDGLHVDRGEDGARLDRAEERDLVLDLLGERPVGPAEEDVGLDADLAQLHHRVLRGLVFTSCAVEMYGTSVRWM